ncbi:hypothetical protein ASG66_14915 [Bacillus sp. Leaf406]|nr:hypothetical protein ASG66_14915 [Bacillus sp. Leaf406]
MRTVSGVGVKQLFRFGGGRSEGWVYEMLRPFVGDVGMEKAWACWQSSYFLLFTRPSGMVRLFANRVQISAILKDENTPSFLYDIIRQFSQPLFPVLRIPALSGTSSDNKYLRILKNYLRKLKKYLRN